MMFLASKFPAAVPQRRSLPRTPVHEYMSTKHPHVASDWQYNFIPVGCGFRAMNIFKGPASIPLWSTTDSSPQAPPPMHHAPAHWPLQSSIDSSEMTSVSSNRCSK